MKVHVVAYGGIQDYLKQETIQVNLKRSSTVSILFQKLEKPRDEIWMVSVNGKIANEDTILAEGDLVSIFEPVRGG